MVYQSGGGGERLSFRHPEERALARVSKDGRELLVHPSRLAVKNGEHLRMTLSACYASRSIALGFLKCHVDARRVAAARRHRQTTKASHFT
jgi:hypothetical protein